MRLRLRPPLSHPDAPLPAPRHTVPVRGRVQVGCRLGRLRPRDLHGRHPGLPGLRQRGRQQVHQLRRSRPLCAQRRHGVQVASGPAGTRQWLWDVAGHEKRPPRVNCPASLRLPLPPPLQCDCATDYHLVGLACVADDCMSGAHVVQGCTQCQAAPNAGKCALCDANKHLVVDAGSNACVCESGKQCASANPFQAVCSPP